MRQGINILFALTISLSLTSIAQAEEQKCTGDSCAAIITTETNPKDNEDKKLDKDSTNDEKSTTKEDVDEEEPAEDCEETCENKCEAACADDEKCEEICEDACEKTCNFEDTTTDIDVNVKSDEGGFFIGLGGNMVNLSATNDVLKKNNYTSFSNMIFSPTIGVDVITNNILFEGQGTFLWGQDATVTNKKSNISGIYGLFNLGYVFDIGEEFSIFPLVGIGGGGYTLENEVIGTKDFQNLLTTAVDSVELTNTAFLLNAGVGAKYKIRYAPDDKKEGYVTVGLRGGYIFSPFNPEWKVKGSVVTGSPNTALSGPYLMITIGG